MKGTYKGESEEVRLRGEGKCIDCRGGKDKLIDKEPTNARFV